MASISPLIARLWDDPHARNRRVKRDDDAHRERLESKGRVPRRRSK